MANRRPVVPCIHFSEAPVIALEPVESSQLAKIGHHPESNTLAIEFKGYEGKPGSLYHYANFTAEQFATFSAAESFGSYFLKNIKPNALLFPCTRIDTRPRD